MNRITSNANFAIAKCKRFTQFLTSPSKAQGSIQQTNKYERSMQKAEAKLRNTALTCGFTDSLDNAGTLQARALKGSERAASRIARSVALVIGISLSIPMAVADGGSIDAIEPKKYIRLTLNKTEAKCLIKLYGKESAFNHLAIGNLKGKNHVYGIPQLKNPIIYDKSPIEQIQYGLKYINHRYSGDSCLAWKHWLRKGWH